MPFYYIFSVTPDVGDEETLHRVAIPTSYEKGFYRSVGTLNSFCYGGERADATTKERAVYRAGKCWKPLGDGNYLLYYGMRETEWIMREQSFEERWPGKSKINHPKTDHASIWDFYKHIGFDYKLKKYVA